MAISRSVLAKSHLGLLQDQKFRGLARAALGLPNPQGRATGNCAMVTSAQENYAWGNMEKAGLARCRRVSQRLQAILGDDDINGDNLYRLFEQGEGVEYELTQACIEAVLEEGEDKGEAAVSEDAALYPACMNLNLTEADILKVAQDAQHEPRVPNSDAEWELEQAVFMVANNPHLPEWTRKLVGGLWREVCHRERWYHELQDKAAKAASSEDGQD